MTEQQEVAVRLLTRFCTASIRLRRRGKTTVAVLLSIVRVCCIKYVLLPGMLISSEVKWRRGRIIGDVFLLQPSQISIRIYCNFTTTSSQTQGQDTFDLTLTSSQLSGYTCFQLYQSSDSSLILRERHAYNLLLSTFLSLIQYLFT